MGKLTPVGAVLIVVMVAGFTYGFLGHGEAAGFSLLIAGVVLAFVAGASFARGGRAGRAKQIEEIVERVNEARRDRDAHRTRDL